MTFSRRNFIQTAAAVSAGLAFGNIPTMSARSSGSVKKVFRTSLYKANIIKDPTDELCDQLKSAGYEGIEVSNWNVTVAQARTYRSIAEKSGLRIHSVMRGWASFNNADATARRKTIDETITSIRAASNMGADTVLLVPCRIDVRPMPEAWDFNIDFDPETLQVKTVVKGDNNPYTAYIKAQNQSTEMSVKAIEELIPVAAKEGVRIAIENVWNNLWCTPELLAAFVRHFESPWVGGYLDLGNHTKYARAEEWIKNLGHNIVKLHIKGFKVNEVKNKFNGGPGDWVPIDKASIDWKSVRQAIDDVGFNGYISVEEKDYDYSGYSAILDKFIDGTL